MNAPVHQALTPFFEVIGEELAAVERHFDAELVSDLPCVNNLVRHVSRFRGKMLRPCLVLLCGKAVGPLKDDHITIATVVEMIHMSTLVHDDVLDEAELRRRGATINHLRGNEAAVLLGDYLISHSYHLCSSLSEPFAARQLSRTTNEVCAGELMQIDNRNNIELDEPTYCDIISRKTASLCAVCCLLGAHYAGTDEEVSRRLQTYGRELGIAFQIQDDILDLVGDVNTVGKTLGSDVRKGKMTLPLIHFLRTAPAAHRELLRSLMEGRELDKVERIRNLLLPSGSMEYARRQASKHIAAAHAALEILPPSPARDTLAALADFVLDRPM